MKKLAACLIAASALAATQARAADVENGKKQFQYWCATCHAGGGGGMMGGPLPGTFSLMLKYKNTKPPVLEDRTDLTPDYVTYVVRNGIQSMPFFRKTELSDKELGDVGAYLARNTK